MDRHVHEAALRAAAQLVFALGAAGCANPEPVAARAPAPAPAPPTADECLRVIATADESTMTSQRFVGCCVQLAATERAMNSQGGTIWNAQQRFACCAALQWDGSLGCSPWGPPAPPPFMA